MNCKVTTVIVNYKSSEETLSAVNALLEGSPEGYVFPVIVENDSGENEKEILEKNLPKEAELVVSKRNLGYAGGINLAIPYAKSEFFLVLNPDTKIMPGALETMVDLLSKKEKAGVVGPLFVDERGNKVSSARKEISPLKLIAGQLGFWSLEDDAWKSNEPFQTGWIVGACMLFKTKVLDELDWFDDGFFLYFEETDICRRLKKRGWEVWSHPGAICMHSSHGKSAERSGEELIGREILKFYLPSRRRYLSKHHGPVVAMFTEAALFGIALARWLSNSIKKRPGCREKKRILQSYIKAWLLQFREIILFRKTN